MAVDLTALRQLARNGCVDWSAHATQRMIERNITRASVISTLENSNNEVLEVQPPQKPWQNERYAVYYNKIPNVIAVVTFTIVAGLPRLLVITVEHPQTEKWALNFNPPPSLIRIK